MTLISIFRRKAIQKTTVAHIGRLQEDFTHIDDISKEATRIINALALKKNKKMKEDLDKIILVFSNISVICQSTLFYIASKTNSQDLSKEEKTAVLTTLEEKASTILSSCSFSPVIREALNSMRNMARDTDGVLLNETGILDSSLRRECKNIENQTRILLQKIKDYKEYI